MTLASAGWWSLNDHCPLPQGTIWSLLGRKQTSSNQNRVVKGRYSTKLRHKANDYRSCVMQTASSQDVWNILIFEQCWKAVIMVNWHPPVQGIKVFSVNPCVHETNPHWLLARIHRRCRLFSRICAVLSAHHAHFTIILCKFIVCNHMFRKIFAVFNPSKWEYQNCWYFAACHIILTRACC
jgi:hypothetical protein